MLDAANLDAVLTYAIVAVATLFVLWRVVLPASLRARLKRAAGSDCATRAPAGGCAGGCAGCGAAKQAKGEARGA